MGKWVSYQPGFLTRNPRQVMAPHGTNTGLTSHHFGLCCCSPQSRSKLAPIAASRYHQIDGRCNLILSTKGCSATQRVDDSGALPMTLPKKSAALLAIAGMLTTPLAFAQDASNDMDAEDNVTFESQAGDQTTGNPSFAAGLQEATGLTGAQLGAIGAVVVIGAVAAANSSSSTTGTN